jgi:hypothetical protein
MLDRAQTEGRVVSVRLMINSQRGSAATVQELQQEFAGDPRVQFKFYDNTQGATREVAQPPEAEDYSESRRQLNDILDTEYREGRISREVWQKVRGPGIDSGDESVRGGVEPQNSGGNEQTPPGKTTREINRSAQSPGRTKPVKKIGDLGIAGRPVMDFTLPRDWPPCAIPDDYDRMSAAEFLALATKENDLCALPDL